MTPVWARLRWLAVAVAIGGGAFWVAIALRGSGAVPEAGVELPIVREELTVRVMAGDGWRVTDQYVATRVMVLNIQTDRVGDIEQIARDVVGRIDEPQDEVLVYFHRTNSTSANSFAGVQWTPQGGYRSWRLD